MKTIKQLERIRNTIDKENENIETRIVVLDTTVEKLKKEIIYFKNEIEYKKDNREDLKEILNHLDKKLFEGMKRVNDIDSIIKKIKGGE